MAGAPRVKGPEILNECHSGNIRDYHWALRKAETNACPGGRHVNIHYTKYEFVSIEELKKRFIVNPDDFDKTYLPRLLEVALKYCRVDTTGRVHVLPSKMTVVNRIKLFLAARLLANQLDQSIPAEVPSREIADSLLLDPMVVNARLKEIKDDKFAFSKEKGVYRAFPHRLDAFLMHLSPGGEKK